MDDTRIDTEALKTFLNADPKRAQLLMTKAPISEATLRNLKRGYQPGSRTAKAVNQAMREIAAANVA